MKRTDTLNINRATIVLCLLAAAIVLESCTTWSNSTFDSLQRGMLPSQVARSLGSPDFIVGEVTTKYGQQVVVWEYEKLDNVLPGSHTQYWVYFVDGLYRKWHLKGDWVAESRIINNTDFSLPADE